MPFKEMSNYYVFMEAPENRTLMLLGFLEIILYNRGNKILAFEQYQTLDILN